MNPDPAVEAALPVRYAIGPSHWQLAAQDWEPAAVRTTELIEHPERIPAACLFKQGERRLIFRLEESGARAPGAVVKSFPLTHLRHRWKHQKYAPGEVSNLFEARRRGLPVPRVFGLGLRRRFGLVSWNAAVVELMPGRPLKELLAKADETTQRALLRRVLPLFKRVYEAGCNHIDFGPHAILLEDAKGDCLIDFQYCRFLPEPAPKTFAAVSGYFAWCLTTHWNLTPPAVVHEWFDELLDFAALGDRQALRDIFQHRMVHRASASERLSG